MFSNNLQVFYVSFWWETNEIGIQTEMGLSGANSILNRVSTFFWGFYEMKISWTLTSQVESRSNSIPRISNSVYFSIFQNKITAATRQSYWKNIFCLQISSNNISWGFSITHSHFRVYSLRDPCKFNNQLQLKHCTKFDTSNSKFSWAPGKRVIINNFSCFQLEKPSKPCNTSKRVFTGYCAEIWEKCLVIENHHHPT